MKINRLIILTAAAIVGCRSGGEAPVVEVSPVLRLNSGIRQYSGVTIPLPEKTEIGLFTVSMGQSLASVTTDHYNLKFTAGTAGRLVGENPVMLTGNESYTVYGYGPYREGADNPESILFPSGTDVFGCPVPAEIRNVSPEQHTGILEFIHCTAQIRFVVKIADETLGELSAMSVLKATGFLPEGRLDVTNGHLTGGGEPSEVTAVKAAAAYDNAAGKYTLESQPVCFFILPDAPQTIQLRVTHGGVVRTGSITQTFNPGESYTYTIYVGRQSELMMDAVLTPWITENEIIEFN